MTVFVVILLGPMVWKRAVYLARKQIHADLPISLAEIQAERDGLRAEHAVAISAVGQKLTEEKKKTAELQVKLGRQYDELTRIPLLEGDVANLAKDIAAVRKDLTAASADRDIALEKAGILEAEAERLQNHLNALQGLCDTLRIEVSAKEAEYTRLFNELSEMRRERKSASLRYNEVSTQLTATQTELKSEKRRNEELQKKLDRLIIELSDAQEMLERQNRGNSNAREISDDLSKQNSTLREEISALAARVIADTARKEGVESPIHQLLKADEESIGSARKSKKNLASRIKDLQ